jgi:hypothetical protein
MPYKKGTRLNGCPFILPDIESWSKPLFYQCISEFWFAPEATIGDAHIQAF